MARVVLLSSFVLLHPLSVAAPPKRSDTPYRLRYQSVIRCSGRYPMRS
jgi:hypothetical protein